MSALETGLLDPQRESEEIGICRLCFASQAELEKRHRQLTTIVLVILVVWMFIITLIVLHSRDDMSSFKQRVASDMKDLNDQLLSETYVLDSARQTIAYLQHCTGCTNPL